MWSAGRSLHPRPGRPVTLADFLAHVQGVVATDPSASRWHVVVDNLDIHRSASLVGWVAAESGLDLDLGVKGNRGRWRISRPRSWRSSTTTIGRWPSPSSGPIRASRWSPNHGAI